MAIAYQASVDSFGGTAFYLERGSRGLADPAERVEWIETRNLGGLEETQLSAKYMDATAAQNPHIEKGGYHFSISFHPEDRPLLDQERMSRIADQVLEKLGLKEHQALIVAHKDTEHPHFHVLVNRVHPESLKAWDRWQDRPRMQESLRHLELEHGLRRTPGYLYQLPGEELLPNPELSRTIAEARRGREAFAEVLRERGVAEELKAATSWQDLEARLEREGLYLKKAGRGLQLTDGEERTAKPSRLHRKSSLANLEQRFGEKYAVYRAREPQKVAVERTSSGRDGGREIDTRAAQRRDFETSLERLRKAFAKGERWDQLVAESREVSSARTQLAFRGNLVEIDRHIKRAEIVQGSVGARFPEIFRDPEAARAALEQSYADVGRGETYRRLALRPQEFGKLHGQQIFGRVTEAREKALDRAYSVGREALDSRQREQELRPIREQADGYRRQQNWIREEQGKLGKGRDDFVAGVGRQAKGLDLRKLKRHLTPEQYKLLERIRRDEREHLKPLRVAIKSFDAARAQGRKGVRLAKTLAGLYRAAPQHIVLRLLPPQVQAAVAAVKLVRSLARSMNRGLSR